MSKLIPARTMLAFLAVAGLSFTSSDGLTKEKAKKVEKKSTSKVEKTTKKGKEKKKEEEDGFIRPRKIPGLNAKIDVSGYRTLLYQSYSSSGNEQNFKGQNGLYFSKTKLQQEGFLTLRGTLNEGIWVEGELMDRPFDDPTFKMLVRGKNALTRVGDFDQKMGAGPLLGFTKSLRGFMVEGNLKNNIRIEGVFTKQKSQTERQSFQGRNIRGPYQLGNISVVEGSETVKINGVTLSATAYTFDYFLGELTFRDPVSNADLVEVTYESALFLSNNSSAVQGAAIHFTPPQGPIQGYLTVLQEGVNALKSSPIIQDARTFTSADLNGLGSISFNAKRLRRGSVLLEREGPPGTFTLLRENQDWTMDYPNGVLTLAVIPPPGTRFQISFEFYNESNIRRILDEVLSGQGRTTFQLQKSTIYSGTENVELYQNDSLLQTLQPGRDYLIDETNNSLTVLSPFLQPDQTLNRTIRIDYEIVNNNDSSVGQGRRHSIGGGALLKIGKDFKISFDAAQTKGDISPKTVQVTEQVLSVADGIQTVFNLPFTPILGTQEVYFDDTFSPQSRKVLGSDFDFEPGPVNGSTNIRFRVPPPNGTVIYVSYKYLPTGLPAKRNETGNSFQTVLDGSLADGKVSINATWRDKDRAFSPNNDLNTLENHYLDGRIDIRPAKSLTLSYARRESESYVDFSSSSNLEVQEDITEISYAHEKLEQFTIRHSTFKRHHPATIGRLDLDRKTTSAFMRVRPFRDRVVLSGMWSDSNQDDSAGRAGSRDLGEWELGVALDGSHAFTGAARIKHSDYKLGASPLSAVKTPITFKTTSKELSLNYSKGIFLGNADYSLQSQDDSRIGRNYSLQDMNIDFSLLPKGIMERFYVAFTRRDYPSDVLGLTRSGSGMASFTVLLGGRFAIVPNFTRSTYTQNNYSQRQSSLNETSTYGATLEYRRRGDTGLSAQFLINAGDRNTETIPAVGPRTFTRGDTTQNMLKVDYLLKRYSLGIAFENNADDNNAGIKTKTQNKYIDQTLVLGSRVTLRGLYNRQETKTNLKSDRDRFLMELRTKTGKNLDFLLSMEWQDAKTGVLANDYDGTIGKAELRARF